ALLGHLAQRAAYLSFVHAAAARHLREAHRRKTCDQRQKAPFGQAQLELLEIALRQSGAQRVGDASDAKRQKILDVQSRAARQLHPWAAALGTTGALLRRGALLRTRSTLLRLFTHKNPTRLGKKVPMKTGRRAFCRIARALCRSEACQS